MHILSSWSLWVTSRDGKLDVQRPMLTGLLLSTPLNELDSQRLCGRSS
jgi:hypothetical protein